MQHRRRHRHGRLPAGWCLFRNGHGAGSLAVLNELAIRHGRLPRKLHLGGQAGVDEPVGEAEQHDPAGHEQRGVDDGEPGPHLLRPEPPGQWSPGHGSRYPQPTTVSIGSGSPSLRRSLATVTVTVLVNGSAFSSQTRSSRSSALTTAPSATSSSSSTPSSFLVSDSGRPPRLARRLARSKTRSPRTVTGGAAGDRLASARTRATSSANANGLVR